MRVHWKIWFLGGGSQKTNIQGELPKKGSLRHFADLREGGVDTPMHTMHNILQDMLWTSYGLQPSQAIFSIIFILL